MAETFEEISAAECVAFYSQGYSINELANTMGCSYTRVRNILLKSGDMVGTRVFLEIVRK